MRALHWSLFAILMAALPLFPIDRADAQIETFNGRLVILRADNFKTGVSTTSHYLRTLRADGSDMTLRLFFPDGLPDTPLHTGDAVTIQGRTTGGGIEVRTLHLAAQRSVLGSSRSVQGLPAVAVIDDRRAVVLIVDMQDAANSLTITEVAGFMYTDPQNVRGLYEASSFQQLGFDADTDGNGSPDVFGPLMIDYNAADGCNEDDWADAADAAAQAAGIDLSIYQHKVYALPSEAACGWSGLGSIGCSAYFCKVWVRDGGGTVFAHELGHNLGWYHASTDPENDGSIDSEYGDRSGVMGYPYWSQVNAPHRDQRQWFDGFPGSLQVTQTSGAFEIHALELDPGVDPVDTQVVKIPKADTNEYYYLSYRRRIGDYPVHSSYADKINIHRNAGIGSSSVHIDNLEQGETFTDSINAITIAATATGGETASVTVTIAGAPFNAPPTASFSFSADKFYVQFTDASSDSDGTIVSRAWDFGDGTTSSQTNPSHTYTGSGAYSVRLAVTDDDGMVAVATRSVMTNHPPAAAFDVAVNGLQVTFSGTCSDSDGTVESTTWDFGDGNRSTSANPVHTYADYGTYTVNLTAVDNDGGSTTISNTVGLSSGTASLPDSGSGGGGSGGGCFIAGLLR